MSVFPEKLARRKRSLPGALQLLPQSPLRGEFKTLDGAVFQELRLTLCICRVTCVRVKLGASHDHER